ncbi:LysM peptidoglycan-binding domain-containing protein [Ornithinimicrobium sp. Y1694]|uniref:LysM peptidoglycan-binding domain-containing protein n=1 Tax=Ornithinimicrobium sp. Y1694 TaxID=3418590 RepID=UPI003CF79658
MSSKPPGGAANPATPIERTHSHQTRAIALGAAGTGLSALLATCLLLTTVRQWPGVGVIEVAEALSFLALAAAAGLALWATALLADATFLLVRQRVHLGLTQVGRARLSRRLATGLLALAASGAASPALAVPVTGPAVHAAATANDQHADENADEHDAPTTPQGDEQMQDPADGTTDLSHDGELDSEAHEAGGAPEEAGGAPNEAGGATDPGEGHDIPVPGWTPTVLPAPSPTPHQQADVSLVGAAPRDGERHKEAEQAQVVVLAGDSLWAIAARQLGPDASSADIAEHWPRWYAANQDIIGPDPDLILPGQVLTAPALPVGAGR